MYRSLKFVLFSLCVARFCSAGVVDNYGPQTQAKNGPWEALETQLRKPEEISDIEWQELRSYRDWNLPTQDQFPLPEDAQKTPQKNDLIADLGTGYKVLDNKLTKGKNFNPLALCEV